MLQKRSKHTAININFVIVSKQIGNTHKAINLVMIFLSHHITAVASHFWSFDIVFEPNSYKMYDDAKGSILNDFQLTIPSCWLLRLNISFVSVAKAINLVKVFFNSIFYFSPFMS